MSFYDGIGMMAEKNAVVIDLGSAYTKVGYAGEAVPRAVIRTPPLFTGNDDAFHDALVKFTHKLYFEHLLVTPKDRRVVLVEGLLGDLRLRDTLVRVLFRHYEVLSILLAPSHLMPLFGLGLQHGLVLDAGFREATLIPVYQNVPILKAWQALPLASEALHTSLKKDLVIRGTAKSGDSSDWVKVTDLGLEARITEDIVEDIKVRLCFVTDFQRGQQIQQIRRDASSVSALSSFLKKSVPPATYFLNGDTILRIDGEIRESACEVLFEQDNDRMSISTMVLDSLLNCPIDTRRQLAANIVIVGGTSMILGFKSRLFQEMKYLLTQEPYKGKLLSDDLKLHSTPAKPNIACWAGASLFGSTDAVGTRSFTRESYFKDRSIPDWSNLRYNTVYNDAKQI